MRKTIITTVFKNKFLMKTASTIVVFVMVFSSFSPAVFASTDIQNSTNSSLESVQSYSDNSESITDNFKSDSEDKESVSHNDNGSESYDSHEDDINENSKQDDEKDGYDHKEDKDDTDNSGHDSDSEISNYIPHNHSGLILLGTCKVNDYSTDASVYGKEGATFSAEGDCVPPAGTELSHVTIVMDDGGKVYVNGEKIYRIDNSCSIKYQDLDIPMNVGVSNHVSWTAVNCGLAGVGARAEFSFYGHLPVVNHAPVITLSGNNPETIFVGTTFVDSGATATDTEDGDITTKIISTSTVNSNLVGDYTVKYNVKDSQGLAAIEVVRVVKVIPLSTQPFLNIVSTNIVCSSESDLPNYGLGGPDITSHTAADYVSSHPNCHIEPNWKYQWSFGDEPGKQIAPILSGDFVGEATTTAGFSSWNTFGPGNLSGIASTSIYNLNGASVIWVREVLKEGYIPFSYPASNNNVSAEMYCHKDVMNFDNYDYISSAMFGQTYYCVSWNVSKTITPPTNHPPVIILNGENPITIILGSQFTDPGATASDQEDGNITSSIISTSTVNSNLVGDYTVKYNVKDSQGLAAIEVVRVVKVIESTSTNKGKITFCLMLGDEENKIATSSTGLPNGVFSINLATSTNFASTSVASKSWSTSTFSPNARTILGVNDSDCVSYSNLDYGTYNYSQLSTSTGLLWNTPKYNDQDTQPVNNVFDFFSYSTTTSNSDGVITLGSDRSERSLIMYVTHKPEIVINHAPVITLVGENPATTTVGTLYVDPGATAVDTEDGVITGSIIASSTVNSNIVGTYTITYDVKDSKGLPATTVTRVVNVVPAICLLPQITSALTTSVTVNQPFSYTLSATSTSNITYSVSTSSLPAGLSFSTTTNTISGTPTAVGVSNVEIRATNLCGNDVKTLVITVNEVPTVGGGGSVVNVGGGGGGGNGPIVGSYGGINTQAGGGGIYIPAPTPTPTGTIAGGSCTYLNDYLRKDFNNNPVEVKKLQSFLKSFEGFSALEVNGTYDDATVDAVNIFQMRYKSDILTPWGHTAPTAYTYIFTKKKVNEIYCNKMFPVTTSEQSEIDIHRNNINSQGVYEGGVGSNSGNAEGEVGSNNNGTNSNGGSSNSNGVLTTLAGISSTTGGIANKFTANVIASGKKLANLIFSFFTWPFKSLLSNGSEKNQCEIGYSMSKWLNLIFIVVILLILYLWYRQYRNNKRIEEVNKEIDLQ